MVMLVVVIPVLMVMLVVVVMVMVVLVIPVLVVMVVVVHGDDVDVVVTPVLVVMVVVVVVTPMLMVMRFLRCRRRRAQNRLLHAIHKHAEMGARDAALHRWLGDETHARYAAGVHFVDKPLLVIKEFKEGGGQHVASSSHTAVQVKCFHCFALVWLIILAM
jgi:hypothetical protein